jgi:hypothetical protein
MLVIFRLCSTAAIRKPYLVITALSLPSPRPTIYTDLKHCNCYSRLLPPVKSSTTSSQTGGTDVTLPLPNKWLWFSNGFPVALPISMTPQNKNVLFISPWSVIGMYLSYTVQPTVFNVVMAGLANRALGHRESDPFAFTIV